MAGRDRDLGALCRHPAHRGAAGQEQRRQVSSTSGVSRPSPCSCGLSADRPRVRIDHDGWLALLRHVLTRSHGTPATRARTRLKREGELLTGVRSAHVPRCLDVNVSSSVQWIAIGYVQRPTGVNPKIVSQRLGHASVGFTLTVYSHALPGYDREPPTPCGVDPRRRRGGGAGCGSLADPLVRGAKTPRRRSLRGRFPGSGGSVW
jgi:hypothetical protein